METIIKKAISGGWVNGGLAPSEDWCQKNAVLDKTFWKSISKNEKWLTGQFYECVECLRPCTVCECRSTAIYRKYKNKETYIAVRFHEMNLTDGWDSAVTYLKEIIK